MAKQIKVEKIQSIITRDLTIIMTREIRDLVLNTLTISEVKLSSDLSLAKVYYTSLLATPEKELQDVVNGYKKEIRSKLAGKLDLFRCPDLEFIYDKSLQNANRIDDILKKIQ